jgi:hypothetical protein
MLINVVLLLPVLAVLLVAGCSGEKAAGTRPVGTADAAGSGDDSHGDEHVHGPRGGEIFELAGTDMMLECVAKYRDNLVLFYLYEADGKTAKKVACEALTGSFLAGEVQTVSIPAVDTADGLSSRFEVEDEGFAIARKTRGVKIDFEIDGEQHTLEIPKDPHG